MVEGIHERDRDGTVTVFEKVEIIFLGSFYNF
jgi:hypothetical protein